MIRKIDYRFFRKAKTIASVSDFKKFHIGCVAVYQGKIIGLACNTQKTHPMQKEYNAYRNHEDNNSFMPRLHAEIACLNTIRKMDINFAKVKLYICRERTSGEVGLSRPCVACMQAIIDLGIKYIYYTTDAGYACEKIS